MNISYKLLKLDLHTVFTYLPVGYFELRCSKIGADADYGKLKSLASHSTAPRKPRVSTAHINFISFQTRMPRILVNQNQNENINLSDLDIQRIVNFLYYQLNKTGRNFHKFNVVLKKMDNLVCVMHFGQLFHFPN